MTAADEPVADAAITTGVRHAVRVWLPDRPGALGAVASRIGSLGGDVVGIDIIEREGGLAVDDLLVQLPGDVVGIDIIEREGGLAVDDLLVQLPGDVPLTLLCREIAEVDDVQVEDVRTLTGGDGDGRLDALAAAVALVESGEADMEQVLVGTARTMLAASWAAVVRLDGGSVSAASGLAPEAGWMVAFARGRIAAGQQRPSGTEEVLAVPVGRDRALCLGRNGASFRAREVDAATLLARLARLGS